MTKAPKSRAVICAGAAIAMAMGVGVWASAHADEEPAPIPSQTPVVSAFVTQDDAPTTQPLPRAGLVEWISSLQNAATADERFGNIRVHRDQKSVILFWHGEVSDAVASVVAAAPRGVSLTVQDTDYLPGELRRLSQAVFAADTGLSGAAVVSSSPNVDGSGLTIGVVRDATITDADIIAALTDALGQALPMITVEDSEGFLPIRSAG